MSSLFNWLGFNRGGNAKEADVGDEDDNNGSDDGESYGSDKDENDGSDAGSGMDAESEPESEQDPSEADPMNVFSLPAYTQRQPPRRLDVARPLPSVSTARLITSATCTMARPYYLKKLDKFPQLLCKDLVAEELRPYVGNYAAVWAYKTRNRMSEQYVAVRKAAKQGDNEYDPDDGEAETDDAEEASALGRDAQDSFAFAAQLLASQQTGPATPGARLGPAAIQCWWGDSAVDVFVPLALAANTRARSSGTTFAHEFVSAMSYYAQPGVGTARIDPIYALAQASRGATRDGLDSYAKVLTLLAAASIDPYAMGAEYGCVSGYLAADGSCWLAEDDEDDYDDYDDYDDNSEGGAEHVIRPPRPPPELRRARQAAATHVVDHRGAMAALVALLWRLALPSTGTPWEVLRSGNADALVRALAESGIDSKEWFIANSVACQRLLVLTSQYYDAKVASNGQSHRKLRLDRGYAPYVRAVETSPHSALLKAIYREMFGALARDAEAAGADPNADPAVRAALEDVLYRMIELDSAEEQQGQ